MSWTWGIIDDAIDRKTLWRALIDNACSESAGLSDNELAAILMALSGFPFAQIARVLENRRGTGYLTQTRGQQLVQNAVSKTLRAGGIERRVNFAGVTPRGRPRK